MREEYIRIIREYIQLNPEYRQILNELKSHVLSLGATEREFDEAVRQATGAQNMKKQSFSTLGFFGKLKKGVPSRRVLFSFYLFLAVFAGFLVFNTIVKQSSYTNKVSPAIEPSSNANPPRSNTNTQNFLAQVYANINPVDVEKAFSYPKSNVPLATTSKPKKEVLGFLPYWSFPKADEINLSLITSVSIFGLTIDGQGNIVTANEETSGMDEGWLMWKDPKLDTFIRKARSNRVKIYLTLKSFNTDDIDSLIKSDSSQELFISNALYLLNSKNLDGINIDFEYVGTPSNETKVGFTRLITNLNAELKRQKPDSVLTIDTFITSGSVPGIFEINILKNQVDAFVVMGYDLHYSKGDPGPVSPMGGNVNIIGLIQGYLEQVEPEKIILAVPYYGYDWPVSTEENSSIALNPANILPYAQISEESKKYKLIWDDVSQTPMYTYSLSETKREVHFDNVRSLGIKYDFVNAKNLKGVGIWALGYDGYKSDLQRLIADKFLN